MGFTDVAVYRGGKVGWMADGQPVEGADASTPRVGARARRDVPTCGPSERVGAVRERAGGRQECVVIDGEGVVLGLLERRDLEGEAGTTVDRVMRTAPRTLRPSLRLDEMPDLLRRSKASRFLVTTSEGRFIGLLRRDDFESDGGSAG